MSPIRKNMYRLDTTNRPSFEMSGCNSCDTVSVDPALTPLAASMTGGAKKAKKAAPKKTKKAAGAKKSGGSPPADGGKKCGGSFLGNLGQLAIPLGLIAAKEGVEMLNKNSSKKDGKSKKASGEKKKTSTGKKTGKKMGARRASFGGDPEGSLAMDSAAPYPSSVSDGLAATPVTNAADPTTITTRVSDDSLSTHMGGAERSSVIAQEFRRMATEISSFLEKHKKKAKAAKDAKKKAKK